MGLADFSGLSGECFLVESTRHLARRRSRASGHGFAKVLKWLELLLREARWSGVSNRQFTNGCQTHEQGRDGALGKSFCRSCVANADRFAVVKKRPPLYY